MASKRRSAFLLVCGVSFGLSACGGQNDASRTASANGAVPVATSLSGGSTASAVAAPTLAQGPDVCFRAISKHLGANAKVSEITSFFSSGSEIDSSASKPAGEMTTCTVQYQNPADPRKLVETSLDLATGEFDAPRPVEITVMGGNAATFNLEQYLIPLSQVNAAGLASVMAGQKARLDGAYSHFAWSGVRLEAPDAFAGKHTLRLDLEGRLKSNDIKAGGYASVTTDAKTITTNFLLS